MNLRLIYFISAIAEKLTGEEMSECYSNARQAAYGHRSEFEIKLSSNQQAVYDWLMQEVAIGNLGELEFQNRLKAAAEEGRKSGERAALQNLNYERGRLLDIAKHTVSALEALAEGES